MVKKLLGTFDKIINEIHAIIPSDLNPAYIKKLSHEKHLLNLKTK